VIHAFALEPKLVATWGKREEFRFVHDKFGLGTPRALLELPVFSKWKRAVYDAALGLSLSPADMKRIEELFRLLAEHKCRRSDSLYDGVLDWLENAEREFDRRPYAAILATANPRAHQAVLLAEHLGASEARWHLPTGATLARTPAAFAATFGSMLANCRVLHIIDPYFGPQNDRHRKVLEAFLDVLEMRGSAPDLVRIHCSDSLLGLSYFEQKAAQMADRLPSGFAVEFIRWRQRQPGGERFHNRYVLTDLGGVTLGLGVEAGEPGETDDVSLLTREQHLLRWSQYVDDNGAFDHVDSPATVYGTRVPRPR